MEQPADIDFDRLEKERCVHVCDEVKQLYHSYLFLELQGFLDGSENPAAEKYPDFILIGSYGKMDASLCVDIVTGKVYSWDLCDDTYEFEQEGRYKAPELLADSLTELLLRLSPVRKQFSDKDGKNVCGI